MKEVNKYSHTPRRVFEKTVDRLESKVARLKGDLRDLRLRVKFIEDFLANSPHAQMWEIWQASVE